MSATANFDMGTGDQHPKTTEQIGLPTPSTPPAEDFDHDVASQRPSIGLSTPFSPTLESFSSVHDGAAQQSDHLLFPHYHTQSADKPLFDQQSPSPSPRTAYRSVATVEPAVAPAPAVRQQTFAPPQSFPRSVPETVVGVVEIFHHDPVGYARFIDKQNNRHRALRRARAMIEAAHAAQKALPPPVLSSAASRDAHTQHQLDKLDRAPRVKKGKPYSCPSMTGPIIGMPPGSPDGPPLKHAPVRSLSPEVERPVMPHRRSRDSAIAIPVVVTPASPAKRRRSQVARPGPALVAVDAPPNKRRRRQSSVAPSSPLMAAGSPGAQQQHSKAKTHTRAQASKKVEDDLKDSEWMQLPDFCPPISTLDAPNAKKLRVSWGSSDPLDLSSDSDSRYLHPQELALAATLRFHCNQYLINKRRIFKAKVRCLQEGRAFNKTACQQCTAMDVNKASKLWAAFDEVGWFDEAHFHRFA